MVGDRSGYFGEGLGGCVVFYMALSGVLDQSAGNFSVGATLFFTAEVFYEAVAMLLLFILLGHWLEMRARAGASRAAGAFEPRAAASDGDTQR